MTYINIYEISKKLNLKIMLTYINDNSIKSIS